MAKCTALMGSAVKGLKPVINILQIVRKWDDSAMTMLLLITLLISITLNNI